MTDRPEDSQREIEDVTDDEMRGFVEIEMHENERQDRLWLQSCTILIESLCKVPKSELDGRTLIAINETIVHACDRASRIFQTDVASIEEDAGCGRG